MARSSISKRLRRLSDALRLVGPHALERGFADAELHEQVALELQPFSKRRLHRAAHEPLDVGDGFGRVCGKAPCDLERALERLAVDALVHEATSLGVLRRER